MHGPALQARLARRRLVPVALLLLAAAPGCSRSHFRERADRDVAGILTQKNVFPNWAIQNFHVYPDPRARFGDPSNPDHPPYPPDDYAARVLSPNPQRPWKKYGAGRFEGDGYLQVMAQWDAENRARDIAESKTKDQAGAPGAIPGVQPREKLPPPKSGPLPPSKFEPLPLPKIPMAPGPKQPPSVQWRPKGSTSPVPSVTMDEDTGVTVASAKSTDGNKAVPAVAEMPKEQTGTDADPKAEDLPAPEILPDAVGPAPFPPGAGSKGPLPIIATGEAAEYLAALATNEAGYRIRMEQAVQLGLINSREFQDRREDLYLAALPVSLERFSFAAQGFFTEAALLDFAGRALGNPRNTSTLRTNTGFSRLFPTGALLLVRLANQVVIDLGNGKPTTTVSNLSVSLAQPFLRGGGYAVTLEPLTLAERNMLYAIRSYARFRKLFFVAVSAGGNITNNPYGLQGLSVNLGRGIGGNLTAPSVGFLSLLLQSAQLTNQVKNVQALEGLLNLYRAFREGGQQSDLQVAQVEQQLINNRNQLLGSSNSGAGGGGGGGGGIRGYLDTLDNFKLQLGLPLTVGLNLDDTPLQPIRDQLARFDSLYADVRQTENDARQFNPAAPVAEFRGRWRTLLTSSALVKGTEFAKTISGRWTMWEKLSDDQLTQRLAQLGDERRKILDRRADRQIKGLPEPKEETLRVERLASEIDLGEFERVVRIYESQPWAREKGKLRDTIQAAAFRDAFNAFFQVILEGRNERLEGISRQWPKLPPIIVNGMDLLDGPLDDAMTAGMQAALSNRLDLMNARGQVVDAWRQIKVQANSLQGVLNVEYNLNTSTPPGGGNPAAFSGPRTNHNITINGELPLVRRAERNQYRAAIIGYQRQRRTLMAFEDNIANDVRSDIRAVRTIAALYQVQQRLVELGYFRFDNSQAILLAPPAPGAQADAGSAVALTQNVLDAQSQLLNAQNALYQIYVNYLVARMVLYLDLEIMQIDERGVWCNEFHTGNEDPNRPAPAPGDNPGGERLPPPRVLVEPGAKR